TTQKRAIPPPRVKSRGTPLVTATSTKTARGAKFRNTDMCGIRTRSKSAGRLIAPDTGATLARGDGLGLTTNLGAMRRFTTDAGPISAIAGAGAQDPIMRGRIGARRSSDSTAEAALG